MSKVVAERMVAELEASGFVILRKPVGGGSAPLNPPASCRVRGGKTCGRPERSAPVCVMAV
jgi:hypothetical protein